MKTVSRWENTFVVAALFVSLFPALANAGSVGKAGPAGKAAPVIGQQCLKVTNRPLSDFLNAQGKTAQFFPPVKDYVGWTDAVDPKTQLPTTFALVDYAGLANNYIEATKGYSLGTTVTGYVVECDLANNKSQITVALFTTKALGFAQSITDIINSGFLDAPTIFGAKAQEVVKGAPPALGPASLFTTFSIPTGSSLPDLVDVAVNNPAHYAPVTLSFASATFGTCSNGLKALLTVREQASTDNAGNLIFSEEIVKAVDSKGHSCGGKAP